MKIIRDEKAATYTLIPVEEGEDDALSAISGVLSPGDIIHHSGWVYENGTHNVETEFCIVHLLNPLSNNPQKNTPKFNPFALVGNVDVEDKKLPIATFSGDGPAMRKVLIPHKDVISLHDSTREDKCMLDKLNNTCYYASQRLTFLGEIVVESKKAITVTGAIRCKCCGGQMLTYPYKLSEEEAVCDTCAAKCNHKYRAIPYQRAAAKGLVMDVMTMCELCARRKPKTKEELKRDLRERKHNLAMANDPAYMQKYMQKHMPGEIKPARPILAASGRGIRRAVFILRTSRFSTLT